MKVTVVLSIFMNLLSIPQIRNKKKCLPLCLWGFVSFIWLSFPSGGIAKDGEELIGTKAPGWETKEWFNSKPLSLDQLKGKVVLVRWWTGPQCPYCAASADALNEFHAQYKDKGFTVVGLYHHKSYSRLTRKHVRDLIKIFKFKFPNTIDRDWKYLKQWWLDDVGGRWTSVSFLLDQDGIIRYIHPGGKYVKGDKDYSELKTHIEKLLGENEKN